MPKVFLGTVNTKYMAISVSYVLGALISLPKTLYFNFRALPIKEAYKIPFIIWHNVRIVEIHKGIIRFPNGVKPFMVRMGYGGSLSVQEWSHSIINLRKGHVIFEGNARLTSGFSLDCGGELSIGKNFSANKNSFISCSKSVKIGDNVMLGDNVTIRDSDGHTVYLNELPKMSQRPVVIGNHVWIASHACILKGAKIGDNSILAYGALLIKGTLTPSVIWGGATGFDSTNRG